MKDRDAFDELQRQKKRKLQTSEQRKSQFDNPAKSSPNRGKAKAKSKRKLDKKIGIFLTILQGILSAIFLWTVFKINLLPTKYLLVVIFIIFALFAITFATQKRHKGHAMYGKSLSVFMILILSVGSFYIAKVNGAFDNVTGGSYKIDSIVVAVLKDDPAETIADAKDYSFGVQYAIAGEGVRQAVDSINETLSTDINTVEYEAIQDQATALHDGSVKAIIYNEGYTGMLAETFEGYESSIKIIHRYEIKTQISVKDEAKEFSVTKDTFSVYISGIDVFGAIETNSRSDVNIIATVNPKTHQILLSTTPRDFYVTIPDVSNGQKDKLTHAGIYGVDASIATLENLYDTKIPFYARVNFTSIIEIVDQLGGIDVYSEYSFTTADGYYVQAGMNHFNGEEALSFSRERYNVPGGDDQRGKNQQAVIVAMIRKIISPQILMKASGLIDSVSGNVETNMTQKQIQELVKMQLSEGCSWNIYSAAASGTGGSDYTYSMPGISVYVTYPDKEAVDNIKNLMDRVEDGEMLDGSEVAE